MAAKRRGSKSRIEDKHAACVSRVSVFDMPTLLREAQARLAAAEDRQRKAEFVAAAVDGIDAGAIRALRAGRLDADNERRMVETLRAEIDRQVAAMPALKWLLGRA
jgi:hypothetical protein